MADIVERLRRWRNDSLEDGELRDEAAAEIARLRASERAAFKRGVEAAAVRLEKRAASWRHRKIAMFSGAIMADELDWHVAAIRAIEEPPT